MDRIHKSKTHNRVRKNYDQSTRVILTYQSIHVVYIKSYKKISNYICKNNFKSFNSKLQQIKFLIYPSVKITLMF